MQRALTLGDKNGFDVKPLQGSASRFRLRVGDYRVVYTLENGQLVVWVLAVGNRREIYRST
ncbi:type II toxin-antitoxin system RelE/ParE family toxin [Streptomyces sp. NPDC048603]|uniref:type II toxin-antitoxin system RelE family toxin n=1 Tax=Streptomyces sp. NPDC048603 TaxID=3365577 RepID=UPI003724AF3A